VKYGLVFTLFGILFAYNALVQSGFYYILCWPAIAFISVGIAYFINSPSMFGKRKTGTLNPLAYIVLLPFIALNSLIWHITRIAYKEDPYNKFDDRLYIGRRLINREVPVFFDYIIDLTSEFNEPKSLRSKNYINIPLLDSSIQSPEHFIKAISRIQQHDGITYIHCAQGHGRTGLAAATWLMLIDPSISPEAAISKIKAVRPRLDLNRVQRDYLKGIRKMINSA